MYFPAAEVHRLLSAVATRLPGAALVFDAVPEWLAARSRAGGLRNAGGYEAPAWQWAMSGAEARRIRALGIRLRRLRPSRGRGLVHGALLPLAGVAPGVRDLLLTIWRAGLP